MANLRATEGAIKSEALGLHAAKPDLKSNVLWAQLCLPAYVSEFPLLEVHASPTRALST